MIGVKELSNQIKPKSIISTIQFLKSEGFTPGQYHLQRRGDNLFDIVTYILTVPLNERDVYLSSFYDENNFNEYSYTKVTELKVIVGIHVWVQRKPEKTEINIEYDNRHEVTTNSGHVDRKVGYVNSVFFDI